MLQDQLMAEMKTAMKAKDQVRLTVLRAVKAEILKAKTSADFSGEISEKEEVTILTRMLKQRKDAAEIYKSQNRADLCDEELKQADILMEYLPKQLDASELESEIRAIVGQVQATGPKDMGKVMGLASKQLAGKAEGKAVAAMVKTVLNAL
ncbi:MAG: GatB/YqeY domain-containing protein [Flavobacteriales bacterium]